jgi:hypothetical protein
MLLPVSLVAVAQVTDPPLRRAGLFGLVLGGAGLLTTGSRMGLLAAGGGCLLAAAFAGLRTLPVLAAAGALGLAALPAGLLRRLLALAQGLEGTPALGSALGNRAVNWGLALEGFHQRPWLGAGPGTRAMGFLDSELLLALEGGGVLGALALAALVAVLWLGLRGRGNAGETGALGAMVVLSVGLVVLHISRIALPFAILAGAGLGEQFAMVQKRLSREALESG